MDASYHSTLPPSDPSSEYWQMLDLGHDHNILHNDNDQDRFDFGSDFPLFPGDVGQMTEGWPEMNFFPDLNFPSELTFSRAMGLPPQMDNFPDSNRSGDVGYSPDSDPASAVDLQSSQETLASDQTYLCDHCPKTFQRRCDLKRHLRHHTRPVECPLQGCTATFPHQRECDRHIQSKHKLVTETDYKTCWTCGRRFIRTDSLKRHFDRVHKVHVSFRSKSGGSPATASSDHLGR